MRKLLLTLVGLLTCLSLFAGDVNFNFASNDYGLPTGSLGYGSGVNQGVTLSGTSLRVASGELRVGGSATITLSVGGSTKITKVKFVGDNDNLSYTGGVGSWGANGWQYGSGDSELTFKNSKSSQIKFTSITITTTGGSSVTYVAPPTFSPKSHSEIDEGQWIYMNSKTSGAQIHYSWDGGMSYEVGYSCEGKAGTLQAYAEKDGVQSEMAYAVYTIKVPETPTCATPTFSANANADGTYAPGTTVYVACSTADALISVTGTDGFNALYDASETNSFTLPKTAGSYTYTATASADGYEDSATATKTFVVGKCATPTLSIVSGSTVVAGSVLTISCSTPGAKIEVLDADFNSIASDLTAPAAFTLPTEPGTYTYNIVANATGYVESDILEEVTYTVKEPDLIAPVISFSEADGSHFAQDAVKSITLSLNSDVYPVPDKIYYTLDGYKAHNHDLDNPVGVSPEGKILSVDIDSATKTAVSPIEISLDAHGLYTLAGHKSLTINAHTSNVAGEDIAAATYIFDGAVVPESKTVTVKATDFGLANAAELTATTLQEVEFSFAKNGGDFPPKYYTSGGLRFYNKNQMTVKAPANKVIKGISFTGTQDVTIASSTGTWSPGRICTWSGEASEITFTNNSGSQWKCSKMEITLENGTAPAAAKAPALKAAEGETTYTRVTSVDDLVDGTEIIMAGVNKQNQYIVMSTEESKGYKGTPAPADFDGVTLVDNASYRKIVIEENGGYKYLKADESYLSSASSGADMKIGTTKGAVTIAKASDSDFFDVKFTSSNRCIRYNYNNTSVFRCYATSQANTSAVYIYKKVTGPVLDPAEKPTFDKESGGYEESVTVTIASATAGATIHYTDNGGEEQTGDSPMTITLNTIGEHSIVAWATADGFGKSQTVTANYTITEKQLEPCDAPTFAEDNKTEDYNQVVIKVNVAEGTTVKYTVDGGDALIYDGGIVVSGVGKHTVKAWAEKDGFASSEAITVEVTVKAEPVEDLFLVMDRNLWDVVGENAYRELAFPFTYEGNGIYTLETSNITTHDLQGNTNHGIVGRFYVRDGKANNKGLTFYAAGTYATKAFVDGESSVLDNDGQQIEKGKIYDMAVGGDPNMFTTQGIESHAFTSGKIIVTYRPGTSDVAGVKTLELDSDVVVTGIENVGADVEGAVEYFNLQGMRISEPVKGQVVIRRQGARVEKIAVR